MNINQNVIDLYCGAGGLSLGAERAGFDVVSAVELDEHAMKTHTDNFPNTISIREDILKLTGKSLLQKSHLQEGQVSGIIGGPPCQGFSTMGRRNPNDERNNLFVHFFQLISEILPDFFLAENVPGILNSQYDEVRSVALSRVESMYQVLPPLKLSATQCGAPTERTRVFFVGFLKSSIRTRQDFSKLELPKILAPAVEVALDGLPKKLNEEMIRKVEVNEEVQQNFPYFFSRVQGVIPSGVGNPKTLPTYLQSHLVTGFNQTTHTAAVKARFSQLQPGKIDRISKSKRLDPSGFSPTLRAGTGPEHGSFQAVRPIHFSEDRVITPREAARLQGFPDWFTFDKTIWHSFRQIGNSVSPLVAEVILTKINQMLTL